MYIFSSFLGIFKSAILHKTSTILAPYNKKVIKLCEVLEELGFIYGFTILTHKQIKVFLKFYSNKSVIRGIHLVSKPSSRVHLKIKNLKGYGINSFIKKNSFTILTTSAKPIYLTDIECFLLHTGGEPVCVVN